MGPAGRFPATVAGMRLHRRAAPRSQPGAPLHQPLHLPLDLPLLLPLLVLTAGCSRCGPPHLDAVGPRIVSNQTAYPVMLYGDRFTEGMKLQLGPPYSATLPCTLVDKTHATALLPATRSFALGGQSEAAASARLLTAQGQPGEGEVKVTVIDDVGFPQPTGLVAASDGQRAFVVSPTTDEVWVYHLDGAPVERIPVGDGPRALALFGSGPGERLAVVHDFSDELRLLDTGDPKARQTVVPVRAGGLGLTTDPARPLSVFIANHRSNTVQVVTLPSGAVVELEVGVRPRALAVIDGGRAIAVANAGSGDVSLLSTAPPLGPEVARIQPRPGTSIVGGHTEKWAQYVVGGRQPRALAWSQVQKRLFVASAGVNLGPNPDKLEISTNGGIGVVDPATGKWVRHVSILAGVPQSLALDDARGLLYAADLSRGLLTVLDTRRLAESDEDARTAVLASLPLPPAPGAPHILDHAQLGQGRRAGVEVLSGPESIALVPGGETVLVLSRFDGSLTQVDVRDPRNPKLLRTWPGPAAPAQPQTLRRAGELLYYTDVGRSSMSCDACHPGGHDDGVFYAKTHPLRFYRSSTLRAIRETPPYFFPGGFPSLEVTGHVVMGRNRLHNPDPTQAEVRALSIYQAALTPLPNPFLNADGSLPEKVTLPDGRAGNPRKGLATFETKAGCRLCHPAPHFTLDQSPERRGQSFEVGTPVTLDLHPEWQELQPGGHQVPSLTGAWDEFPLLASGAGGLAVKDGAVVPTTRFPLRTVLEWQGDHKHGNARLLSAEEKDDLLAYLLTL